MKNRYSLGQRSLDRFIAVDVEIAGRTPIRICAIGAARFESGMETGAFHSLVRVDGPVRFTRIHGLRAVDLLDAADWPTAWRGLLDLKGDIETVVGYRVRFDRGAILAMSARYGIRVPPLRFVCAAELMERHFGKHPDLSAALDALGRSFPGRPHDPLADARAAGLIVLACVQASGVAQPPDQR
jgi:DNA polymerase-3 subunit epsilon